MLILSFIAQLFGLQAFAQDQVSLATDHQHQKSLLWRISGKDLTKPSFVFGTIHAICQEDYFFTEQMSSALNECNQLILEVSLNDPGMASQLQQRMLLPEGKQLRDYFSGDEPYQVFADKIKAMADLDIELFSRFKPFVLISALAMKGFSCPTTLSYEMKLIEATEPRNVPVVGLETAESQLQIFDHLSNEEIERMLLESVSDDHAGMSQEAQMIDLYKQEDLDGLYKLISQSGELKGHEAEFLTNRNQNWSKLLPAIMSKEASFVAVGAAHLPGENGVLNLLRKAGYMVEAIH